MKLKSFMFGHKHKFLMVCIGRNKVKGQGECFHKWRGGLRQILTGVGQEGSHPRVEPQRSCRPGDSGRCGAAGWWGNGSTQPGCSVGSLWPSGCPPSWVLRASRWQNNRMKQTLKSTNDKDIGARFFSTSLMLYFFMLYFLAVYGKRMTKMIQTYNSFTSVQYSTALCFVFSFSSLKAGAGLSVIFKSVWWKHTLRMQHLGSCCDTWALHNCQAKLHNSLSAFPIVIL